jgi:hypothetical protein
VVDVEKTQEESDSLKKRRQDFDQNEVDEFYFRLIAIRARLLTSESLRPTIHFAVIKQ